MTTTPSQIWISAPTKEAPQWVVERMTTMEIDAAGSFEIEAADGAVTVKRGFAVFDFNGQVFACEPKNVQAKLASVAGQDNEVVQELAEKTVAEQATRRSDKVAARAAPAAKAIGAKALNVKPMTGSPPVLHNADVTALQVDDSYQRSIEGGASQKLIVKMAENWDWRLCLPLLVSRRAGTLFVIDGQHRLEAARLRGDIPFLPVVIFDFNDPRAEAELFVAANRSRRAMSKLDDFHAAIVAGDPKAVAVNEVVVGAGLQVGRIQAWQYWKAGEVVFVTAIQRALHSKGKEQVARVLGMVGRAFEGLVMTGVGSVFEGLIAYLCEREGVEKRPIDDRLMETVLTEVGIPGWKDAVDGAESGQERVERMKAAIVAAYSEAEGVE